MEKLSHLYRRYAYYFAIEDPIAAGIVECEQPDNFCGSWDSFSDALGGVLDANITEDTCQTPGVKFYLKFRVQYAGAAAVDDFLQEDSGLVSTEVPFWIQPLFAWESVFYRVDGYQAQSCSDQFRTRCVPLNENGVDSQHKLQPLNTFAQGVAYFEAERSGYRDGFNVHDDLESARIACQLDCECIGIIMAKDQGLMISLTGAGAVVGTLLLLWIVTITKIWYGFRSVVVVNLPLLGYSVGAVIAYDGVLFQACTLLQINGCHHFA